MARFISILRGFTFVKILSNNNFIVDDERIKVKSAEWENNDVLQACKATTNTGNAFTGGVRSPA